MDAGTERISRTIWIGVGLLIVILCVAFVLSGLKSRPRAAKELPVIGPVAEFTLTNQDGRTITLADLKGKVWVADIIFSRCPGPCPRMTRQLGEIQSALPANSQAKLVSLTTDPDYDTPEILKKYPERPAIGVKPGPNWLFLTGTKKEIAGLAVNSLKLGITETEPDKRTSADDLWIHSTYFVVVDKQARLRAVFETVGEDIEWTKVRSSIVAAVEQLERER